MAVVYMDLILIVWIQPLLMMDINLIHSKFIVRVHFVQLVHLELLPFPAMFNLDAIHMFAPPLVSHLLSVLILLFAVRLKLEHKRPFQALLDILNVQISHNFAYNRENLAQIGVPKMDTVWLEFVIALVDIMVMIVLEPFAQMDYFIMQEQVHAYQHVQADILQILITQLVINVQALASNALDNLPLVQAVFHQQQILNTITMALAIVNALVELILQVLIALFAIQLILLALPAVLLLIIALHALQGSFFLSQDLEPV